MNAVNQLQEYCARRRLSLPLYTQLSVNGEDHSPTFTIQVEAASRTATGTGVTKAAARKMAASHLLVCLGIVPMPESRNGREFSGIQLTFEDVTITVTTAGKRDDLFSDRVSTLCEHAAEIFMTRPSE